MSEIWSWYIEANDYDSEEERIQHILSKTRSVESMRSHYPDHSDEDIQAIIVHQFLDAQHYDFIEQLVYYEHYHPDMPEDDRIQHILAGELLKVDAWQPVFYQLEKEVKKRFAASQDN